MTIHGHEAEKLSLEQIGAFLNARQEIRFEGEAPKQIYHWIEQVLGRQEYHQQSRPARGLLRSYLTKMTGLSRAQVTRWIARSRKSGSRQPTSYRRYPTPLETLLAWPNPAQYLRPGLTPAVLQRIAAARSDPAAAERMPQAKRRLFAPWPPPAGGP